jgi:hypothetical protein
MCGMPNDLCALLLVALRAQAGRGPHADAARHVVLAILLAHILAGSDHDGPPHAAGRAPRHVRGHSRRWARVSLSGRRPRG